MRCRMPRRRRRDVRVCNGDCHRDTSTHRRIYALARGAVGGSFPYFFIDVGAIGYARALVNAAALSVAMLVAGLALVAVVRTLRRA